MSPSELRSAWSSWVLRRPWSILPIIELIRQYRVATHRANVFSFSCQGVSRGSRASPRTAAALTVHPELVEGFFEFTRESAFTVRYSHSHWLVDSLNQNRHSVSNV